MTNRQYAFARIWEKEAVIVAVNNDENAAVMTISLPVEAKSCMDAVTGEAVAADGGKITVELKACGSVIIKINQG